ncbi:putative GNAT family acetyltransferase [Kribbella amoyensis]|uniref:Putative GNAT family acetyltransferase n=1 Tax=Kribbella amoyensis TaxID=996641 RepID=A0A561BLK2_9ACTN|nr:GNAT family N-acetyltransferase [Kribbella amoyensis]TWD79693.1 putative GNAT family acetyltransferase [Kribbella amoyensis]
MVTWVTGDAGDFRARVFAFLERDPVLHTVILSNVDARARGTYRTEVGSSIFVAVVDGNDDVVGAAMRTPGQRVYLGGLAPEYASEVATAFADHLTDLRGVAGRPAAAEAFAQTWAELRHTTATATRGTRLHKLIDLTPLQANGVPRLAADADVDLAAEWVVHDFGDEIGDTLDWARGRIADKTLWFWDVDGTTVSMAGHHLPIFGVCRVGPVYTPTEYRRNGYAGALTTHVTATILAQGNQACLYTDLANPTSNKIYHAIGYRPITDFVDLEFTS